MTDRVPFMQETYLCPTCGSEKAIAHVDNIDGTSAWFCWCFQCAHPEVPHGCLKAKNDA